MCGRNDLNLKMLFDRRQLSPATPARKRCPPRPARQRAAMAAAALLALCGPASGEPTTLFDRTQALAFEHRCSEPARNDNAYREALALFEPAHTPGHKAIALGSVRVGWVGGVGDAEGVAVELERLRLALPRPWHDAPLAPSVALTDTRTGRTATGAPSSAWFAHATRTGLVHVEFRTSGEGELDWVRFPAPDGPEPRDRGHAELVWVDRSEAPGQTLRVDLVIAHRGSGERLVLEGPVLERLDAWMDVERPTMRRLGLLETLNPFQRGGLWHTLRLGSRYDRCVRLRDAAQAELDRRFEERPPPRRVTGGSRSP